MRLANNGVLTTFNTAIDDLSNYAISVLTNPTTPNQTCAITTSTGAISGENKVVAVVCATNQYFIGGMATGLVSGNSVVLNLGTENLVVDGSIFVFVNPLDDESMYDVSIQTLPFSPSQTCTASNNSGQIAAADVTNVEVDCVINQYTIGGTVTGMYFGNNLQLSSNFGENKVISEDGSFIFSSLLDDLSAYDITISVSATDLIQSCLISNGSGILTGADVNDVTIVCEAGTDLIFENGFE